MRLLLHRLMLLLGFFSTFCNVESGKVERIYIRDNIPALKERNIQIVCEILQFTNSDKLNVYKSDTPLPSALAGIQSMTVCGPSVCLTTGLGRNTFSADRSHVFINISNINRSEDQKWWTCAIENQRKDMKLQVITVPTSLQYESQPSKDLDLALNAGHLICSTGCSFPRPTMNWYYSESGKDSLQVWNSSGTATETESGCSDSERKYSSTLSLPKYTTFQGNLQKTVQFKCHVPSFKGMSNSLYTNYSTNFTFAVKVSNATLKDGTDIVSGQLQVVSGISKTLQCDTSVSRPASTILWYIGTTLKQTSMVNIFTFIPENIYHNKMVYCKAYNIQPEIQAVTSYQAILQVQVQVSSVILMDGPSAITGQLQVVSGVSKTLTCETNVTRPAATVVWYIGTVEKQRSTSNTFTFTPDNRDHDKEVYCKAFNTQPESQAINSRHSTLYVKVYASTPTLTNQTDGNLVLLENDSITMECKTSATRPAAKVTWMKGSTSLTNVSNTNVADENLVFVKSVVTFTPVKADDRNVISCQTFVAGQDKNTTAQQRVTVYWPPSKPIILATAAPFLEGQTAKSIYCSSDDYGNPASTATWTKQYGTPDNSDSRVLYLPTLTSQMNGSPLSCQLDNYFTQVKGLTKKSSTERLNVEYKPTVQIMIDGLTTNSVTKNEGQELTALCNVTGNPTPTVKWTGQISNSSNLIFYDIDRSSHGRYTCRAEAISKKYPSYNFVSEKSLDITVYYAPEVTVVISHADPIENITLKINCSAKGRPNNYIFTSLVQTWRGIKIQNSHLPVNGPFDGMIEIQKLELEDSGTYTCHVNNGILDKDQKLDQIGQTDVFIKVSPKVLLQDGHTFAGAPGKSINISIPFYSKPDIRSVKFHFKNGTEIHDSDKYTTSYTRQNVTTKFYGQPIELEGYLAVLEIDEEEQNDFVNYTFVLENGIGEPLSWNIFHISESQPLAPKFINFTGFVDGVPTFLLMGNFNGGRLQTFVVETLIPPSTKWNEVFRFNETDKSFIAEGNNLFRFNITGLSPNTYSLRVLAENALGQINENLASTLQFTIPPQDGGNYESPPIAAIVGGLAGAVFAVLMVFALFIFWKRRTKTIRGESASVLNRRRGHESDDSDDEVMTENQAYVSADEVGITNKRSAPDTLYAQPQKTSEKATRSKGNTNASENEDPSKLYAVPDKKVVKTNQRKQKKVKEDKKVKTKNKKDDIYENASELTPVKFDNGGNKAYEENPYENPLESKVNRNKDGLIYADLTFNDQPKGQKKLVIHGLDSMTEYVEVDFTKKADPLPDSDEENK